MGFIKYQKAESHEPVKKTAVADDKKLPAADDKKKQ